MGRKRKKPQYKQTQHTGKPPQYVPQAIAPQQQAEGASNAGSNVPPASVVVPIRPQSPQSPSADNNARERCTERRDRWRLGVEIGALFVGVGGVVGLLWTLSETQESNRISREALTSVQRAYVGLKTIEPFGLRDPREPQGKILAWQFFPQWENSGTTPTKTMRQHINLDWFEKPISADFNFPDTGPKETSYDLLTAKAVVATGPLVVLQDVMTAVKDKKFHLYFWGWVAYRDIFQNSPPHLTEFCQELVVNSGNITMGGDVKFLNISCTFHNCVDERCADYEEVKKKLGEQ